MAYCACLESMYVRKGIVSSTLTASAFGRRSDLRRTQSAQKVAKETFNNYNQLLSMEAVCHNHSPKNLCGMFIF